MERFAGWWLPAGVAVAGVVGIVLGHGRTAVAAAGVGFLIIALMVWLTAWMFRMNESSSRDREAEERAREFFDEHGRWPGENE